MLADLYQINNRPLVAVLIEQLARAARSRFLSIFTEVTTPDGSIR